MATITGTTGNDTLDTNLLEDDTIQGLGGNDLFRYYLTGWNDVIVDSGGNDTIQFDAAIDFKAFALFRDGDDLVIDLQNSGKVTVEDHFLSSNNMIETLSFSSGYTVDLTASNLVIGESGNSAWTFPNGTSDADLIFVGMGQEEYLYRKANGISTETPNSWAGDGDDTIFTSFAFQVYAEEGNDTVYGNAAVTWLGEGNDTFYGVDNGYQTAEITVYGGDGNDLIYGTEADDNFHGDYGNTQYPFSQSGSDIVTPGDDIIYGYGGDDTLGGNEGNDQLYGGDGNDKLLGGSGDDLLDAGAGDDDVWTGDGLDIVYGGDGNDWIRGRPSSDPSSPGTGNKTIYAGDGDDVVSDGADDDYIEGGFGNDEITVINGSDIVHAGVGDDFVNVHAYENEIMTILGETGDDHFLNQITGINGTGTGTAIFFGGNGNDSYMFSHASASDIGDNTVYDVSGADDSVMIHDPSAIIVDVTFTVSGNDLILTFADSTGSIVIEDHFVKHHHIENLQFGRWDLTNKVKVLNSEYSLIEELTGNADTYTATSSTSVIGSDRNIIEALDGDDVIYAGVGGDVVYGQADDDTLYGEAGDDALYGGTGNDTLYGGADNDILDGGTGDDVLEGGFGADEYIVLSGYGVVDTGHDIINEVGTDIDRVIIDAVFAPEDIVITGNTMTFDANNSITFNDITLIEEFVFNGAAAIDLATLQGLATTAIDFNAYTVTGYGGSQNVSDIYAIEDGGATLHLSENTWEKIDFAYTVTADTILEFDFKSTSIGDLHGVGFVNNNAVNASNLFRVFGTQNAGIGNTDTYDGDLGDWVHYSINVGEYYTGAFSYMFFENDDDTSVPDADSFFRNVLVYENTAEPISVSPEIIDFAVSDFVSYKSQDETTSTFNVVDKTQMHIAGNSWKVLDFDYTVTDNTYVQLDYQTVVQGEIQGLVFLPVGRSITGGGTSHNASEIIRLDGYQSLSSGQDTLYSETAGTWETITVKLTDYNAVGTQIDNLIFVNDDDDDATGDAMFRDIRVFEDGTSGADTLNGAVFNETLFGRDGNDTLNGNDGDDTLYGGGGVDTLSGGNDADTFVFESASAFSSVDTITDFDVSENDVIDIADLLSGYDELTDAITDFVQITDNGTDSALLVDADGGADNFVQVATLLGVTGLTDEDALETSGNLIAA